MSMKTMYLAAIVIVALLVGSCASGNAVTPPSQNPDPGALTGQVAPSESGRVLWGIWEISIDPAKGTYEVAPARFSEFHANVRQFLEEAPCKTCLKLVPPLVPKPYGMDVTISITHPFAGIPYYDGFDVRGIIMLEGDFAFPTFGFMTARAIPGKWALLNPDGFTTAFNALDYTLPGILGYSRGKMVPPSWPDPTNTLNAFKAFYSDGQSENEGGRRGFRAGDTITKTYEIQMVDAQPFRFYYAVDASWEPPTGDEPYDFDDFPPSANCPEAYRFDFSVVSGELFSTGGSVVIGVDVWDHQGWSGLLSGAYEAPECFNSVLGITDPPMWINGEMAHWEFPVTNQLTGLNPDHGTELLVSFANWNDDPLTGPIHGAGRFTIPVNASIPAPVVYSIDPDNGKPGMVIDAVHIVGDYFAAGCTARLEKLGETPIQGTIIWLADAQNIWMSLDLTSAATGKWDVVVENPGGITGSLPEGFEVLASNGCNDTIHTNYLGTGDFSGGTHMPALDACFVHDTGHACDGEFMGYISGFAGTVCQTYVVDTTTAMTGHGLTGAGWGNPHIASWPTPNSIDISEESGQFFIAWSDTPAIVEVWECGAGKLDGQTDASNDGTVYCLDTDGHGGFWDAYFPHAGFACGIKHFSPTGPLPGQLVEDVSLQMPEAWGTPQEVICIPDKVLLVLTGLDQGKIRAYSLASDPPTLIGDITNVFSEELEFGTYPDRPCDMAADWSDPAYAECRIIVFGNLKSGGCELVRIDSDMKILAGPVKVPGHFQSIDINPHTLNVTLWPEIKGSPGKYALVEVPAGW